MKKPVKLAIFDIDGTIFRSSLLIELINGLVEHGVFPKRAKKDAEGEYMAWLDRKGTYEDYINKVIQIYVRYIKNKKVAAVHKVAREVAEAQKDRVYRFTRDLIKKLKKEKYLLMAISGSPIYIVEKFATVAGFSAYFGTEYGEKGGRFTGYTLNLDSALRKDRVLKKYLADNGLVVDLKNSLAVGDTESDVAMLSLVGKQIAFNPNLGLAKIARQKGWQVVVERKDVMYQIKDFAFERDFHRS